VQIGLFSNSSRFNEVPWEDYDADLAEIVVADEAGFTEVWIPSISAHRCGARCRCPSC